MILIDKMRKYFSSPVHKWMRISDVYLIDIERKARLDKNREYFNLELLDKIEKRKTDINKLTWRLAITNLVIFIALIMTVYDLDINFSIAGIRMNKLDSIREILLLTSSFIMGFAAVLAITSNALDRFLEKILPVVVPDKYLKPYEMAYLSNVSLYGKIIFPHKNIYFKEILPNKIYLVITMIMAFFLLFMVVVYAVVSISVHILVIIDIWNYSSLPFWINRFVIFFAIIVDVFYIMSFLLQLVPLRYINLRVLVELVESKKRGQTIYLETRKKIGK